MSKREKILLLITAVPIALALAAYALAHLGTTYEGKTLAEWAGQVRHLTSPQEYQDPEAKAAIRALCANHIPALVEALNYDPRPRLIRMHKIFGGPPGSVGNRLMDTIFPDRRAYRVVTAERAFWALGPDAASAIPGLTRLMYSTNLVVAMNAIRALSGLSTNSLPVLLRAAADPACPARCGAIDVIGRMSYLGTNASPAVPVLVACTQDKDQQVVDYAVQALGRLAIEPDLAVPALRRALTAPERMVRDSATNSLLKMAPQALTNAPAQ